jgi:hypothetical protein
MRLHGRQVSKLDDMEELAITSEALKTMRVDIARLLKLKLTTQMHLTRSVLNLALPLPSPMLGAARGHSHANAVLAEDNTVAGHFYTLSVQLQSDGAWSIVMTSTPPQQGYFVLTLGESRFRTRFNEQGEAIVADVPAVLLTAPDGPDLISEIETYA